MKKMRMDNSGHQVMAKVHMTFFSKSAVFIQVYIIIRHITKVIVINEKLIDKVIVINVKLIDKVIVINVKLIDKIIVINVKLIDKVIVINVKLIFSPNLQFLYRYTL
jgi:hypothetical protein